MTTTRSIAINGNKEFFVFTRFADGSIDQAGPFATGEQAAAEIMLQEKFDAECDEIDAMAWDDEMEHLRWAEAGGYAAGLARPVSRFPSYRTDAGSDTVGITDDIPF